MPILDAACKQSEPIVRNIPHFPNSFVHRLHIWDFA